MEPSVGKLIHDILNSASQQQDSTSYDTESASSASAGPATKKGKTACHCCVPRCNGDSRYHALLRFHRIPGSEKSKKLRKEWLLKIRRDEGPYFKITSSTRVCSRHFKEEDYKQADNAGRCLLKEGVVPSVFDWTKEPKTRRKIIRQLDSREMEINNINGENEKNTSYPQDNLLLQPFHYITQIPGKKIRAKLAKAFNSWLNIQSDKLQVISEIIEMLHNASLLIDDIEDNSKLRRGIPVAHHIYGIPSTINSANYVYFLGLQKLLTLDHPDAVNVFTEQLLELHRGQGMEIYWRDNFICPTELQYNDMTIKKTGGLFGLAVKLMQLFSKNKNDFTQLISYLGLFFQIRDDYSNLCSKEYTENKSYCEDLTEGKFSFPIIHAIMNHREDDKIINIVRKRTTNDDLKRYCVSLLENYGSFEYTRKVLNDLENKCRQEIARLGGNPHLLNVLDELSVTGKS